MTRLTIGLSLSATWLRAQAWRRRDSRAEELFRAEPYLEAARLAERAHLDFLFRPDALSLDPASVAAGPGFSSLDPIVLLTLLAHETERIGLVPTVSTTFAHPYTVARQLQSLDRVTAGRVGWNAVTSLGGGENFGEREHPDDPYADAEDFVAVVEGLRQTYPAEALLLDRAKGRFADPSLLSTVAPRGRHDSAGPLTVPAVSSRPWPLLHAGGSPASLGFAARHADAVFAMTKTAPEGVALRARLRDAAPGRRVRVLPGLSLCLADSRAEAVALAEAGDGSPGRVRHWSVVGTPADAVDGILERHRTGAADGLIALPAGSWRSVELFCAEVVPALAAAGVFRSEYTGSTLHEHLAEDGAAPSERSETT